MSDDQAQPVQPTPTPAYAPAPPPSRRRGRLLLVGGALGVALVAGSAGFALGHATGDDDRQGAGRPGPGYHRDGGPGGFPDGPHGPDGQGPLPD